MQWPKPIAVVDFETTNFDPTKGFITELAVIQLDQSLVETGSLYLRVQVPVDAERIEWVAENTAWGRADPVFWNGAAVPFESALRMLAVALEGRALVAHYMPFESSWLGHVFGAADVGSEWIEQRKYRRDSIDTRDLASPLKAQGLIARRGLVEVAKHFGLEHKPHCALSDAQATAKALRLLLSWCCPPCARADQPSPHSYDHQLAGD